MPFVLNRQLLAKNDDTPPHVAMAQGAEDFHDDDGDSQMASGSTKPVRSDDVDDQDDAEKASQRHPLTGQYVSDQILSGASHGPLAEAMALHQVPRPLAALATAPGGALAGSIASNQGTAVVARLDYRTGVTPMPTANPTRPAPHTAPNQPTGTRS